MINIKDMKHLIFTAIFFTSNLVAYAQKQDFEKYILSNASWKETADTKWTENLTTSKGSLYYLGAKHLDDPSSPQFAEIKEKWQAFKPTIAFFEGPDRGIAETDILTIQKFGESGYVRFLAKEAGIKTLTLEPSPVALYTYLCTKFEQEEVDVYMLAKEAMRLRTRKKMDQQQIEQELAKLLSMFTKMLSTPTHIGSTEQLAVAFEKKFGKKLSWWEAPESWFDPQNNVDRFTNKLALLSTSYRDVFMVEILSRYINSGEKVFAVVGRNHVPLQINAIKYAVGMQTK